MDRTPREFEARWGKPVVHVVRVPSGDSFVVPPNPDRYVLVFWGSDGAYTVLPDTQPDDGRGGVVRGVESLPLVLDHGTYGAIVGLGWRVVTQTIPGNTTTVCYIEGIMSEKGGGRRGKGKAG